MKKQLLKERFQQLAGLKPLYEQKSPVKEVIKIIQRYQTEFAGMLDYADNFLKAIESGKTPKEYDRQEGGRIERDPSWSMLSGKIQGQELYLYLLYMVSKISNNPLPMGNEGDLKKLINNMLDEISEYGVSGEELAAEFPNVKNIKYLGSGDINKDKDILMQLLSIGNYNLGGRFDWETISREEMYKILQSGTLDSASYHAPTN